MDNGEWVLLMMGDSMRKGHADCLYQKNRTPMRTDGAFIPILSLVGWSASFTQRLHLLKPERDS